jgi:hypothetical protein
VTRIVDEDFADQPPGSVERPFLECGHRSCVGGLYAWVSHGICRSSDCQIVSPGSVPPAGDRSAGTARILPPVRRAARAGPGRHDSAAGAYFPLRHAPIRVEARNGHFSGLWRHRRVDKARIGG